MRRGLPKKGRTGRRKQCPICSGRFPFAVDEAGDVVLAAHPGPGQERLPADERAACLGVGARATQE